MKRFETINVIPFIDIMLVLLAIVLTTATFVAQGKIKVHLPEITSTESQPKESTAPTEIKVSETGELFLHDEPITLEKLDQALAHLAADAALLFKVDKNANFDAFVKLLNLTRQHQLTNLAIATETTEPN